MNKYWLYQNLMYDVKHIVKVTWWRKIIGHQRLWVAETDAETEGKAAVNFMLMGHRFGFYSRYGYLDSAEEK